MKPVRNLSQYIKYWVMIRTRSFPPTSELFKNVESKGKGKVVPVLN
jgi:hypothetical protein